MPCFLLEDFFYSPNLEIRSFTRLKAGRSKTSKTARTCPIEPKVRTVHVSAQWVSFGTGSIFKKIPTQAKTPAAPAW
jgi:hypothetical protein